MKLALFDLDNTLLSGDSDYEWGQFLIDQGVLDLLINTPVHYGAAWEEGRWRAAAMARGIPLITTLAGARAAVEAIRAMQVHGGTDFLEVRALQDYEIGRS